MVGPYGDWVKYTVEEPALLAPELDGVRVLTASTHELLRRIPDPLADVYRIGSTTPGRLSPASGGSSRDGLKTGGSGREGERGRERKTE